MKVSDALPFGNLIAHFLPGAVIVMAGTYFSPSMSELLEGFLRPGVDDNVVTSGIVLAVIAMVFGLCVDGLRYMTLDAVAFQLHFKGEKTNFFANVRTKDDLLVYQFLIDNVYRFHQFYGNLFLAGLALLCAKLTIREPFDIKDALLGGLLIVLLLASFRAYRAGVHVVRTRFSHLSK